MARLALVRKRREEADQRKADEVEEADASAKETKDKAAKVLASAGPPKLNPLEVTQICLWVCVQGSAALRMESRKRERDDVLFLSIATCCRV